MAAASLELLGQGDRWRAELRGDWSLDALAVVEAAVAGLPGDLHGILVCDWRAVEAPALACVWTLLDGLHGRARRHGALEIRHDGAPPGSVATLSALLLQPSAESQAPPPRRRLGPLGLVGAWSVELARETRAATEFIGRIALVATGALRSLRALRPRSVSRHVYETGILAVPIVALIGFLVSVIVAYIGSQQLSRFGADIFVVDLVTISVLREFGVLLTAVIIAGRSGSAFAAEIGVMRLNEETDALRAMGMSPFELLVLPRLVALLIALPALTIVADAMGLAGGGLLCVTALHIPLPEFGSRLREALAPTTFWAGLIKAPVFAVLIGLVGTYRGMQVRESARELGRLTTLAVVQSLFLVILADALFAVYFNEIDF